VSSKRSARKNHFDLCRGQLDHWKKNQRSADHGRKSFSRLAIKILRDRASFESRVSIEKFPRPSHRLHRLTETLSHREVGQILRSLAEHEKEVHPTHGNANI
jgi:hypothetical protein